MPTKTYTKLPSTHPGNYKTDRGLFDAFVRALGSYPSVNRSWWIHNAVYEAEQRSPKLLEQFRRLMDEAAPRSLDDLIPVGASFGVGRQIASMPLSAQTSQEAEVGAERGEQQLQARKAGEGQQPAVLGSSVEPPHVVDVAERAPNAAEPPRTRTDSAV